MMIGQCHAMALGRLHLLGQGDIANACTGQGFHQAGFVHHAVAVVAQVEEAKAQQLALRHLEFVVAGGMDLEGFPGVEREDAQAGVELRQLQVPTQAIASVLCVEGGEGQAQGHCGAAEVVGLEFGQVDGAGVLAGARVDTGLDEAEEVEGVGMQGGC
ncbi:hypothetical protein D9M71_436040 [compost metagenome]